MNKKWQREKDNLVCNFDSILQKIGKKKKGTITGFFESSKYQTLTYPYSNQEVVSPEIVTREIANPEILNSEVLNPENNANYQILKP